MFGGLKKSASRLAIVAAAGVLSTGAMAADLGGDCCADLEERVAELEATTARKGNRRMSLTVYGWVNKTILGFNDGTQKNVYLGLDNINSATRFGFRGDAKVTPAVKAGYSILLDVNSGASSALVSQRREEAQAGNADIAGFNGWNNDMSVRMRDANVWLEHSAAGRVTLGRLTVSGPQGTIDLGGIGNVASGSQSLVGGSFQYRGAGGALLALPLPTAVGGAIPATANTRITVLNVTDNLADYNNRVDGLKWDSPSLAGFQVGASIGEAMKVDRRFLNTPGALDGANVQGDGSLGYLYAINARYAGEFSGVRLAAAVGYEVSSGEETNGSAGCNVVAGACTTVRPNGKNLGVSLSAMHAPTGLFAQGHWIRHDRGNNDGTSDRATNWLVQAGISQNFFGVGKTALYGEYSKVNNGFETFGYQVQTLGGVIKSEYKMWGLGVTQDIDAAAMQLYAGYRSHALGFKGLGDAQTIGMWMAGARVNF